MVFFASLKDQCTAVVICNYQACYCHAGAQPRAQIHPEETLIGHLIEGNAADIVFTATDNTTISTSTSTSISIDPWSTFLFNAIAQVSAEITSESTASAPWSGGNPENQQPGRSPAFIVAKVVCSVASIVFMIVVCMVWRRRWLKRHAASHVAGVAQSTGFLEEPTVREDKAREQYGPGSDRRVEGNNDCGIGKKKPKA